MSLITVIACSGSDSGVGDNPVSSGDSSSVENPVQSPGTDATTGDTAAAIAQLAAAYGGDIGDNPPSVSRDTVEIDVVRNGPKPADQRVTVGWGGDTLELVSLDGDLPDWLFIDNGMLDTRPQSIDFRLRTTDITAGQYSYTLAFIDIDERLTGDTIRGITPFTLTLTVSETMTLDQERLQFHLVQGESGTGIGQSVAVYGIDGDWRARSYYDWLSLENDAGSFDDPLRVRLTGAALSYPPGVHSGTLDVSNGSANSITLPVELIVEPRRLQVSDRGLAFSAWPGAGGLRRQSILVSDTASTRSTAWQAATDASWVRLSLDDNATGTNSVSGISGQSLVVGVSAEALAVGYHEAEITLTSTDEDVANTERVVVGLTVLASEPVASATAELAIVSKAVGLIADPVRGRVYVSEGLADIRRFDVYTGDELAPFSDLGTDIRDLAISDDGRTLYAVDVTAATGTTAEATPAGILVIDAATGTLARRIDGSALPACAGCSAQSMAGKILDLAAVHLDGRQLLATNGLVLVDPDSGDVVHDFAAELAYPVDCCGAKDPLIAASTDGRQLYIMNTGVNPGVLHRVDIASSTQVPERIRTRYVASVSDVGNRDLAVSPDGHRICVAASVNGVIPCFATDTDTGLSAAASLADVDVGFHVAVHFASDGRLYTGQNAFGFTDESVGVYDLDTATRVAGAVVPTQLSDRQLVVSGDALRLVTRSHNHRQLLIQSVPGQ